MNAGKTLALSITIACLTLGANLGHSADRNQGYIDACRSEIEQYYGEEKSLSVVNKRRGSEGTRVTLSARSDQDNAEFINCWIPNNDRDMSLDMGSDKVAATVTPVPVIH